MTEKLIKFCLFLHQFCKKMSKNLNLLPFDDVLRKVASFEGFRSRPYRCPSGVLTIGYGHTHGVTSSDRVSKEVAFELLCSDFRLCQSYLLNKFDLKDCMNTNQINALTDFIFNLGFGTLLGSSISNILDKYHTFSPSIRKKNDAEIVSTLLKYNKYRKDGHLVVSSGLTKRRQWEASLYLSS